MSEAPEFQLTVPDSVAADPQAVEIMRVWWSKKEPVMSLKPAFADPTHFGVMLAHAARSMAFVYGKQKGLDEENAYKAILVGLQKSLAGPAYKTFAETPDGSPVQ